MSRNKKLEKTESQKKNERRRKIYKRKRFGNDLKKKTWRWKDGGRIKVAEKICVECKKRKVKFHHVYCEVCHNENRNKTELE